MRILAALGVVLTMLISTPAHAEWTAREALAKLDGKDFGEQAVASAFIHGLATGLAWADGYHIVLGQSPMYCPPSKLSLTLQQNVSILREHVKANPQDAHTQLGRVMVLAYLSVFPCDESGRK